MNTKYTAIISLMIGLSYIIYLNCRLNIFIGNLVGIAGLVTFYPYTTPDIVLIASAQLLGIILGIYALLKHRDQLAMMALTLCFANLVFLFLLT